MSSIWNIAVKDLRTLTRDWLGMFFIAGFPVMMGLLFGAMSGSFSTGSASFKIAVVDQDGSPMSKRFVESLSKQAKIEIEQLPRDPALEGVRKGRLVGAIVLPAKFGETAGLFWEEQPKIQIGLDPSRNAEAGMLQGFVMQSMGELIGQRFTDPASFRPLIEQGRKAATDATDISPALRLVLGQLFDALDNMVGSLDQVQTEAAKGGNGFRGMQFANVELLDVTREVDPNSPQATLKKLRSRWDISFPQAMAWGILGTVAGFAISIVRERERGTLVRLQVAPISRAQIILGKSLACFLMVQAVIVLMVALGVWLGMRPVSYPLLVLASACIGCCFVGLTMAMSVIGRTEEAVSGAGWGISVVMSMFGGGMIPLAFMPPVFRTISHFSPVKWAVLSLEGAIWRGFTLGEMLPGLAVLMTVGIVAFAIGVTILSRRDGG